MKPFPSPEHNEQDQDMIKLLKELGSFEAAYPAELLTARRAAFLEQVNQLETAGLGEEFSAGDQEVVRLLGQLKLSPVEYPPELLAARRSAYLRQMERAGEVSLWERLRASLQRVFQPTPTLPQTGVWRTSLVLASLLFAALAGFLFFSRAAPSFQTSSLGTASTHLPPTSAMEVAIAICKLDDPTSACPLGELDPDQDLADAGNGAARPAVSKDARSSPGGAYRAAYVNDGRGGASWVSNSPDSWIKIDLGKVTALNTVSLQKGDPESSSENDPGQFVIAVAQSDVYADGDSSNDAMEYAQVFHSEQTGFGGTVSHTERIQAYFPPVQARFIKITFEKAGAAIEEVGVFLVEPPVLAERSTDTPSATLTGMSLTPFSTNTGLAIVSQTATSSIATATPTGTRLLTGTATAIRTNTPPPVASATLTPLPTRTRTPSTTPTSQPTNTVPPADTPTPLPTEPPPSDTPVVVPTVVPPTFIPPTLEPTPVSTDPIVVTGNGEAVTFTCNGNDAIIRGHSNIVTLLGSCSSITVTGNGNQVFWQFGSPVITDQGKDNSIQQL